MLESRAHDIQALTATSPEHCLDCFRLIRPGETYYPGQDDAVLCPNCVSDLLIGEEFDTIQATEQVSVDYGSALIRVRRQGAAIILPLCEVRHFVDALVEAARTLLDKRIADQEAWFGPGRTLRSAAMALMSTPGGCRQEEIPRAIRPASSTGQCSRTSAGPTIARQARRHWTACRCCL